MPNKTSRAGASPEDEQRPPRRQDQQSGREGPMRPAAVHEQPNATHSVLAGLRARMPELNPEQPGAVHCRTRYRARIAASLLQAQGSDDVRSVPGARAAWTACGYRIAKNGEKP